MFIVLTHIVDVTVETATASPDTSVDRKDRTGEIVTTNRNPSGEFLIQTIILYKSMHK